MFLMNPSALFFKIWFSLLGLTVGSFLNVVIYRIPRGFSVGLPRRSYCTNCKHQVLASENIPILSYLFLKGKCSGCHLPISSRYPVIEFMTGVLFLAVYSIFGLQLSTLYYAIFCASLLAITFIDIDFRIIPDEISIPGIFFGFLGSIFISGLGWQNSLLGCAAGGGFFWLLSWSYEKITKRDGLGFGDVKLIAMIGAVVGYKGAVFTILASSIMGSVVGITLMIIERKNLKMSLPFGPFLALGAISYLFYGDYLAAPLFFE